MADIALLLNNIDIFFLFSALKEQPVVKNAKNCPDAKHPG
jgi:hypothetical protein